MRDWQTAEWIGMFPEESLDTRSAASPHLPIRHAISHCLSSILASPALTSDINNQHHDAACYRLDSMRGCRCAEKGGGSPDFAPLLPQ